MVRHACTVANPPNQSLKLNASGARATGRATPQIDDRGSASRQSAHLQAPRHCSCKQSTNTVSRASAQAHSCVPPSRQSICATSSVCLGRLPDVAHMRPPCALDALPEAFAVGPAARSADCTPSR
eukprot:CAMPEP_0204181622 /NCGR_PEP_ID=MMETSP0361-20130328/52081_1 /ASSEMBLY_ACC=CAM_ASM_000343 /TAXON_ID=268821 /ORGANISM="Scrippsiella Hangoei, Strain SHTV-5" /LENGTH=124 /DNA_ID=CAMNT_0051141221 /DNA_START=263 /DNA_END=635 /DNA_ORIENTATION=-